MSHGTDSIRPPGARTRAAALTAVLLAGAVAAAPSREAPVSAAHPGPLSGARALPPDSQQVREEAEERQESFETRRRSHLETTWGRPVTRCHEVVGRFCLWHGEDGGWDPREEPEAVREARLELVADLRRAARRIPGDPWVAGQLVRYLLEAGRHAEALEAARACRASAWWCRALAGLVHHRSGRHREAERAFGRALAAMGRTRACRWRVLTHLLDGELHDRFAEPRCGERVELERRLWWLADPLYLVPGNARRTEHFSRWVLDRTLRDAEAPSGVRWGDDVRELLVRYGWPSGWEVDVSADGPRASVISHYPDEARRWLPAEWEHVERPASVPPEAWPPEPWAPRSEYAPSYALAFAPLDVRASRFRRGDSVLVVGAYRLPPAAVAGEGPDADTVRVDGWVRAGLFVDAGPGSAPASATTRTQGRRGVLSVRSGSGGRLLSVEALAPVDSVAGRHRRGIRLRPAPGEGIALSDLMLVEARADSLPGGLGELLPRSLARDAFGPGERVGLYWELYGEPGPADRIRTAVTLAREGGGFLEALGDFFGIGGGGSDEAVRVEWTDRATPGREVRPRTLVVRLPRELPEGEFLLRVEARAGGGDTAAAERRIRVRRDG